MQVQTAGLSKGLKNARGQVKGFTGAVNVSGKALSLLAVKAAAVLGPFLALRSIIGGVGDSFDKLDHIGKFADEMGLTVDQLRAFEQGANLTGSSVEVVQKGIQRMVRRLGEAKSGFGEGVKGLEQLNLSAEQLTHIPTAEALGKISDAIKEQPDAASKAAAAYSLFGRQGLEMLTFLDQGSAGLKQFEKNLVNTQGSISRVDIRQIEAANDSILIMKDTFKSLYDQLAVNLAPYITVTANKIQQLGKTGGGAAEIIGTGMEYVSKGIAFAATVVDSFYVAWMFVKKVFLDVKANILAGLSVLIKNLELIINKLPGVEVSFGSAMENMVKKAKDEAEKFGQAFNEKLISKDAGEKVTAFFNDIRSNAKKAAEDIQKNAGQNKAAQAIIDNNKAALDYLGTLEKQISVIKNGADAAKVLELQSSGVNEAIISQVKALQEQKAALEASKKAQEELANNAKSLTEQYKTPIEQFKSEYAKLRELFDKGLIDANTFKLAALDALPDKVKDIIKQSETPLQKFKKEVSELQKFKLAGLINGEQYTKAVDALKKDLGGKVEIGVKLASANELGSKGAREAILANRLGNQNNPMKELETIEKSSLAEQKKQSSSLEKIAANKTTILTF